jgi:uncharacterized protein (DUF2147 family)
MLILNETGIDWLAKTLISKLDMDQNVKVRVDQWERRIVKIVRGVRQGCLSLILFNLHSKYRTNEEALERVGDFKTGGQVICTVKYADNLVLQGMICRLIEIGRYYGMEMNVEITKVMRISREVSPVQIMIDQK